MTRPLPLVLSLVALSPALAASTEDAEGDAAPAKPALMRHVITVEDHDAAVKAEEARQRASAQSQTAPVAEPARATDAPVAKAASGPVLVPEERAAARSPKASKAKAGPAKVAKKSIKRPTKTAHKPLIAKASGKH